MSIYSVAISAVRWPSCVVLWCATVVMLVAASPAIDQGEIATSDPQAAWSSTSQISGGTGPAVCDAVSVLDTPGTVRLPSSTPTKVRIMPIRYKDLLDANAGYKMTHVPLVAFNGKSFGPVGPADDAGSYYLIPRISAWLNLPLHRTVDLFYLALIIVAYVSAITGLFAYLSTQVGKTLAVLWTTAVALVAYHAGDIYILSAFTALSFLPWILYLTKHPLHWFFLVFLGFGGLIIGLANTIRGHSGTALLIFTVVMLLFYVRVQPMRKAVLLLVLMAGFLLPGIGLRTLIAKRDTFLLAVCPGYPRFSAQHPFWHNLYIAFGFLVNDYVPANNDLVGYAKVQALAPGTLNNSPQYELILKQQVLALVRQHPGFVLATLAAKGGIVLLVLLISANVGLLAAARCGKPWPIELGFWSAIAFSSLPGLLAVPTSSGYLLGLITFASLYAVTSIDFAWSSTATQARDHGLSSTRDIDASRGAREKTNVQVARRHDHDPATNTIGRSMQGS